MEVIGFIGLGIMGKPMALNLMKAGHRLVVTSRSRKPVDEVVAAGATAAASPAEVARTASIIITMVPDTPDVELVLTGPNGILSELKPGTVVIDMSTISPVVTKKLSGMVAAKGGSMLDAPVSGGEIGAKNATLTIMVGGDEKTFERARPILACMGKPESVTYIGDSGAGQVAKLCNQICIGGALAGVAEGFALAKSLGIDRSRVRQALLGGFAVEQGARSPRTAHADRRLQAGVFHASLPEGFAARQRNRDGEQRRDARDVNRHPVRERARIVGRRRTRLRRGSRSVVRVVGGKAGQNNVERRMLNVEGKEFCVLRSTLCVRQCWQQPRLPLQDVRLTGTPSGPKPVWVSAHQYQRAVVVVVEMLLVGIRHGRDVHTLVAQAEAMHAGRQFR